MSLDESTFHVAAAATLSALMETIEDGLGDVLEVDMDGGILTIELDSGGIYVINKHALSRQIWMSSPVSGATHFGYCAEKGWLSIRSDESLAGMLAGELAAATGKAINLGI
jgi:frataxin